MQVGYLQRISISDDHYATSTHDKANLITYLCTQCGLLLQVVHNFCVNDPFNPFYDSGAAKYLRQTGSLFFADFNMHVE